MESWPTQFSAKPSPIVIDQINFQFVPETIAVQTGNKIAFTNGDDTLHNIFPARTGDVSNVNLAKNETYEHQFNVPTDMKRPHQLGCVYHGSMRG
ncbi:MAG: hypothetical protein M2R45_00757 [Verrucomicrobia subdivision 3 bacterium]|nr:hypothetical protein [Limisphaerales bacterium]MCS1413137.1 hypothetical protein [Limisphaerales bacterium]